MKNIYILFLMILPFFCCKKLKFDEKANFHSKIFDYKEASMPTFFNFIISNHCKDFQKIDSKSFELFCSENGIEATDSLNLKKYYTLTIIHSLFTSKSAKNGSRGEILNIPYFWHWTEPNPRYGIFSLKNNKLLNQVSSPKEFSKYKSYADIDRTPYLFLSELMNEVPLYNTNACGDFSTFGWCSEREMAFVCLLTTMGFNGKVITNNNHSWSEFIVEFKNVQNKMIKFNFKIDNTFDNLQWNSISNSEIEKWEKQSFPGQGNWYNLKAHSKIELENVANFIVAKKTSNEIEKKVVNYINKQE